MTSAIVVCIPINLPSRQEIALALERKYGTEYVLMGRVFKSTINHDSCEIEFGAAGTELDRDFSLADDFKLAGQDRFDAATLKQIDNHQQLIYSISTDTRYDACLQIARLTQVLLNIGGIAVKVESAGIAHPKSRWLANYNSDDVFDIYSLFVVLVEGEENYYSCGMQNFGKADVAIALSENVGLAIYVMNVFNYYRLTESPILQDGHTFQPDIECPRYQIRWASDREHEITSPQYNPHGRWHLELVNC